MVAGLFHLAGRNSSDVSEPIGVSNEVIAAEETSTAAYDLPVEAAASRAVVQKVVKIHKKADRRNKRRHSK
jgi:hypothetical protein